MEGLRVTSDPAQARAFLNTDSDMQILTEQDWLPLREAHECRVEPWIAPRLARMSLHKRHPVEDFLFEYYPNRPSLLKRWHPGIGVVLQGGRARSYLEWSGYIETEGGITAAPLGANRHFFVQWLHNFLLSSAARAPFFGCHGLHEWAMVYRAEAVRYESLPLRLSPEEIAATLESLPVRCSHFDAFRFFTPAAVPLNRLQPTREMSPQIEQTGCLHANMDLYKWSFKLSPWCPSELMADAFDLARDIRALDMRASPYDLTAFGYEAVPIETPAGRADYERQQRHFAERARPIRERLGALCGQILRSTGATAAS